MAENLGAIRYDIEIETASMLKAEAAVNKSIANQVTAFDKADKAVRDFEATQKSLGRTINSMGQVMSANGKIVVNATQQYRGLSNSASTRFTDLDTQINATSKTMRSALPDMSNMSYQLQDIAVQAQMGADAFIIIGQQFPQMLAGMGAWAAGVGAAIAVLGLLATTMIDTTSSMEKLEKSIERVQAVITIGANGVANYSEEMQKLSSISKALTRIKLQNALAEQTAGLKESSSAMREAWKEAGTLFNKTSSGVIGKVISDKDQKKLKELVVDFNSGKISIEKFNAEAGHIKDAMSGINLIDKGIKNLGYSSKEAKEQGVQQLIDGLNLFSTSAGQNTKEGRELSSTITDLVQKYKEGQLTIEALNDSLNGVTDSFDRNASTIKDLTNEFVINAIRLQEGERAAFKFGLQLKGLNDDQVAAQLSLFDYNKELEKTKEDAEASAKAIKSVNDELDSFFDNEQKNDRKKSERETESNITFAQSVINKGKSPEQQMGEQYERLKKLRDTDLENAQLYQEAMTSLEQQAMESREAMWSESYQRIGQQAADSMADYLTGVETAEDATRMLASTIVSEVIQSLVKMGLSAITQSMTTTAATTTGIATTTGAAVASTGVMATAQGTAMATVAGAVGTIAGGLATAWAPAAAFASLATLGTNAAPAIAGIYSTMAATLGAQLVGGIASNAITAGTGFNGTSGGRQYGGPVSSGMYRVNETGVPEVYSQGGKDYLMNTKNANITPLDKAQGGGQAWNVNVQNYGPEKAYVTIDEVNRAVNVGIGREAKKASQGRGSMYQGLSKGTNVKNNARR